MVRSRRGKLGSGDLRLRGQKALQEILGQQYHVVVGNPPYITVKDQGSERRLSAAISRPAIGKYSLGVPFTQRFLELALQLRENDGGCGYIGMITANSFMKREFGKKLIEEFFPKIDLTHVIDTSGAYIPGHGTPTVILFGRNRKPVGDTVRAVLGIKGEPSTPKMPSQGLVWQSILKQIDRAGVAGRLHHHGGCSSNDVCHPPVEHWRWRSSGFDGSD